MSDTDLALRLCTAALEGCVTDLEIEERRADDAEAAVEELHAWRDAVCAAWGHMRSGAGGIPGGDVTVYRLDWDVLQEAVERKVGA